MFLMGQSETLSAVDFRTEILTRNKKQERRLIIGDFCLQSVLMKPSSVDVNADCYFLTEQWNISFILPWNIHTCGPNKTKWAVLNCSNWIRFHSLLVLVTLSMLMFMLTPENCQIHLCHVLLTYLGHFVIYPSALWNTGVKAISDFSYYNNESGNQPLGNDAWLTLT